jgi:hypothetical protein
MSSSRAEGVILNLSQPVNNLEVQLIVHQTPSRRSKNAKERRERMPAHGFEPRVSVPAHEAGVLPTVHTSRAAATFLQYSTSALGYMVGSSRWQDYYRCIRGLIAYVKSAWQVTIAAR